MWWWLLPVQTVMGASFYVYYLGGLQAQDTQQRQYALSFVTLERLLADPRRVTSRAEATLKFVPLDLARYHLEAQTEPEPPMYVCHRVEEVRGIVGNASMDHVVLVAHVATSVYFMFGRHCRDQFGWLLGMQWLTIEAPWVVDAKRMEAHLDNDPSRPSHRFFGVPSIHTAPYTASFRARRPRDIELLREYQASRNRSALVTQITGGHSRTKSPLRRLLREECARRGPAVCFSDWQAARRAVPSLKEAKGEMRQFEARLAREVAWLPAYAAATFCIQPFGTTPSRAALFQCLHAGGIPVIFEPYLLEAFHTLFSEQDWAVYIPVADAINDVSTAVYGTLLAMPETRIASLRRVIARVAPRLQYSYPGANISDDAYERPWRTRRRRYPRACGAQSQARGRRDDALQWTSSFLNHGAFGVPCVFRFADAWRARVERQLDAFVDNELFAHVAGSTPAVVDF
ncbi:hypothetical protein CTAYLR_000422 [Chrysophaeum taylorii]|uniref:Exostosin GT47 domain-containing protein n=1 Tax=Chrysophaeum taylorii TaxID=2483200 RepID=A0AAD7XN27_9STRA|nr:hypothetical protein CTAYLR_000422 [Chrysophaeum taylorii]